MNRTEILCPDCMKKKLLTSNEINAHCDNCGNEFIITGTNTVRYKKPSDLSESERASATVEKVEAPTLPKKEEPNSRFVQAKGGMIIRAKKMLRGVTNSFSTPETITIPKGTLLKVPESGTKRGDVFCILINGFPTYISRGYNKGEKITMEPNGVNSVVGFSSNGGGTTFPPCPYALGTIDTDCWEITNLPKMVKKAVELSLCVMLEVKDDMSDEEIMELAKAEFISQIKNDKQNYEEGIVDIANI